MANDDVPVAAGEDGVRPLVGRKRSNRGVWLFTAVLIVFGATLFSALSARRAVVVSPVVSAPHSTTSGVIASPPDLPLPRDWPEYDGIEPGRLSVATSQTVIPRPVVRTASPAPRPEPAFAVPPPYPAAPLPLPEAVPRQQAPLGPSYVFQAPADKGAPPAQAATKTDDARAQASKLLNPATTVPQGTVIQAVLETALDSNRAGFARAVVSRDVSSFDGSRVLIPKGSKLFGEYKSDLSHGQNRALIQWHRLIRPDASIIDVDSPTADPLGRIGVRGKVNSHFFERFGGAILQSALDIGVQLAARKAAGDTYIVGLPIGAQGVNPITPENIKPTLTVRQGTSVSVFVGRDLDFTPVEP
jgi:type IV secretion system protein VirB10